MKYFLLILAVAFPLSLFAYVSPGAPTGHVNDFAGVLSSEAKAGLETTLAAHEKETSNQIAVVTVQTLGDDYIEHYAVKLFEEWGIGTKDKDNGVLLLLAITDRKVRIEVGYGLEGALPDSIADSIIRTHIVPALKNEQYDVALRDGAVNIMAAIQGEYVAPRKSAQRGDWFVPLVFFGLFFLQWGAAVLGRTKEWWPGGALGFVGSSGVALFDPFGFSLITYAFMIAGLTFFGAFFDYVVSNTYQHDVRHGYDHPWWIGGGSGSSGGFGGFGGGMSGGGGASGSW
ncbi:MAG: hypothetical protein RI911_49 [Candidatus Parcubacteria bacterium]|jgi:uncharacterized protein